MAELRECPFCGGEVKIVPEQIDARTVAYNFICDECCSSTYFDYADREESIEAWNNRATESETRAKAIDEFAEKAMRKLTELELKNTCYTVTDCKIILRDVAEQLKER